MRMSLGDGHPGMGQRVPSSKSTDSLGTTVPVVWTTEACTQSPGQVAGEGQGAPGRWGESGKMGWKPSQSLGPITSLVQGPMC